MRELKEQPTKRKLQKYGLSVVPSNTCGSHKKSILHSTPPLVYEPNIELSTFGCDIRIDCRDRRAKSLILANYGGLKGPCKESQIYYLITRDPTSQRLTINRDGREPLVARDDGEFLFQFEKDMTIQLQKLRPELYFLHGAALEFAGRAVLLIAPSGGGKSTTTWGLLHHGFRYLSDELAPVRLESMEVYPYPHAICFKREPPKPYLLPKGTIHTSRTMHVPAELLPADIVNEPARMSAILFLQQSSLSSAPTIRSITKGEAAARLYANALNGLAHEGDGIDGAIEIARRHLCFELTIGDLPATCALVKNTLQDLPDIRITSPLGLVEVA